MVTGRIVRSKAGSDKDSFLVIVKTEENMLYLSDGKRYKLASPKRKNPKHIAPTGKILDLKEHPTDKSLRKALAEFRNINL